MKTSHTRGLNNSTLNFCICLSFSLVTKVQMYRVYYRIVFTCLRQHPLATKLVIGALYWLMLDEGMITPEDRPYFVTGQHNRIGSLTFSWSNNSILTWLSLVEKMFGLSALLWLFYQVAGMLFFGIDFCII